MLRGFCIVVLLFLITPILAIVPLSLWSGVRESLSPTITAVAALLIVASILLLAGVQWLQARAARAAATA